MHGPTGKSPHEFYVYYDGKTVYARRRREKPVAAESFRTAQEAHDRVQQIVNPDGLAPADFGPGGFHSPELRRAVSGNCKAYVEAAYARKKPRKK